MKLPQIMLTISILLLVLSISIMFIGSSKSKIFKQMSNTDVVENLSEIKNSNNSSFLIHGSISADHKTIKENLVTFKADKLFSPTLTITLNDGNIDLLDGYDIADFNAKVTINETVFNGIKAGSDVTIYAVKYQDDNFSGVKGYELYPGMPKQYLNYLSNPYINYMLYVRIFIGLAFLFFILSAVLNKKK